MNETRRGDRLRLGAVLACLALALFVATRQRALWNDGVFFVKALDNGELVYNHFLYLPLAALVRRVVSVVADPGAEGALKLLAACGGAATVALVFLTGLATCARRTGAAAAACLFALLPGTWFHATASELHSVHAACAGVLLLALAGSVAGGAGTPLLAGLGAFLTPASHLSGLGAVVPAGAAVFLARRRKGALALALAAGFGAFGAVFLALTCLDPGFAAYTRAYGGGTARLFPELARIPALARTLFAELLLSSVPASTLLLAGFRTLLAAQPRTAVLFAAWIAAYCAMCFRIGDAGTHGAYYVATFGVQALLAVHAFARIGDSAVRTLGAAPLACLPGVATVVSEGLGLVAWALCAAILWRMARPKAEAAGPSTFVLPAAALALSLSVLVPKLSLDPTRDHIRSVAAFTRPAGLVFFLETDNYENMVWPLTFAGEPRPPALVNLTIFEIVYLSAPEEAAKLAAACRADVERRLAAGESVWIDAPPADLASGYVVAPFIADLRARFSVAAPAGAPRNLLRVEPR